MRGDERAMTAPISFAIAGVVMITSLAAVVLTTQSMGSGQGGDSLEATTLNAQAEGLLRLLLESPGYVGPLAWDPSEGQDADDLSRLGLLGTHSGYLELSKFQNLRSAPYAAGDDDLVNYPEARDALGLTDQGLDFHIRAYPSLADVRQKLAQNIKDPNMHITYLGHVEGGVESDPSAQPTLGALTCYQSPHAPTSYIYDIDIGDLNAHTHISVSLGIKQGGTGPAIEAADVAEISPADGHTATVRVTVPNYGNVGCDATTEVQLAVSDPSATLVSTTLYPSLDGDAPAAAARDFHLSAGTTAVQEGSKVTVSYIGASEGDAIDWAVYDEAGGAAPILTGTVDPAPKKSIDQWFSFDAPSVTTAGFYRIEATHTPSTGSVQTSVRYLAVHDSGMPPVPFTDPSGGATTPSDAMLTEAKWIHDLAARFCARAADDAGLLLLDTASGPQTPAQINAEVASQCQVRVNEGYGTFQPLNVITRHGDIYYDTKDSANSLCRLLLVGQAAGQCDWQAADATLEYTNVLVIGSQAAHNNLVANDFKKSVAKWVDAGGTLIVFGSADSRQWMQSGLGIGHASSSGGITAPDVTHPVLTRPNQLDWQNYEDLQDQWAVDSNDFTSVTVQGGHPITAVSDPGAYGEGNVFLTTWQPHDIFGSGVTPIEGRALLDNMISLSYRDLYLDYGPELPPGAATVPALGRGLIEHDKLGLVEMDFVMYVFKGSGA